MDAPHIHPSTLSNIPKFSGGRSDEAYEWLNSVEELGNLFGWTNQQRLSVARVKLGGSAHQWSAGLGQAALTWDRFRTLFVERFGERFDALMKQQLLHMQLLHIVRQDEGETVRQYSDRFRALVTKMSRAMHQDDVDNPI